MRPKTWPQISQVNVDPPPADEDGVRARTGKNWGMRPDPRWVTTKKADVGDGYSVRGAAGLPVISRSETSDLGKGRSASCGGGAWQPSAVPRARRSG